MKTINCPYCDNTIEDSFEVLDNNVLHKLACDKCSSKLFVFTHECFDGASELIRVWSSKPGMHELESIACDSCNASLDSTDSESSIDIFSVAYNNHGR